MRSVYAFVGAPVVVVLATVSPISPARAEEPPPIQVIMDLHMDPLNGFPLSIRPQVYANWRDAADWAMDTCEARGARITFLAVGEYMEYTLEDSSSWTLIQRLSKGGSLGTHSHNEKKFGPHDWRNLPPDAPMELIVELWEDHTAATDAVVTAALGVTDPAQIRAINNIRGSHLPADDAARLGLMDAFGYTMHQQGPCEEFYKYFKHYVMNPYRPSAAHFLSHDADGPVVISPFGPVLGKDGVHFGIYQDMRLPALKARFLLELLNWLDDVHVAKTGRVWDFGWAAHGSDIVPGQPTRAALPPMLDWLKQNFVDQPVSGRVAAEFSSADQSRDLYEAWQAGHAGAVPFNYPVSFTSWALYPYLMPVAKYLVDAQYEDLIPVGPVRLHRVIAAPEIGGPYPLFVAYPVGPDEVPVNLAALLGPAPVAGVNPRTGLAPAVPTDQVIVPPTGLMLVPVSKRLALPNGDVNLDGYLNAFDIDPFVGVLLGYDTDPKHRIAADITRDGKIDAFDIDPFVELLTGG